MCRVQSTAVLQATAALKNIDILKSDGVFSTDERPIPPINLSETLESHSSSDSNDSDETASLVLLTRSAVFRVMDNRRGLLEGTACLHLRTTTANGDHLKLGNRMT